MITPGGTLGSHTPSESSDIHFNREDHFFQFSSSYFITPKTRFLLNRQEHICILKNGCHVGTSSTWRWVLRGKTKVVCRENNNSLPDQGTTPVSVHFPATEHSLLSDPGCLPSEWKQPQSQVHPGKLFLPWWKINQGDNILEALLPGYSLF